MILNEQQETELRAALRVTRLIAFAMCFAGPAAYALVYGLAVLGGQWGLFLQGFGVVPWREPIVLGLLTVSATTLASAFALPGILTHGARQRNLPPLAALRARSLTAYALLEAVAIYGLVLGFVLGPPAATLSLALMLVPPLLGLQMLPSEQSWRTFCEGFGQDRHD